MSQSLQLFSELNSFKKQKVRTKQIVKNNKAEQSKAKQNKTKQKNTNYENAKK